MSVPLAHAVGGEVFFGVISAVAFATILAVVAGLTLACVSAVSHDLYANVIKRGGASGADQVRVSRFAAVLLGLVVAGLGSIPGAILAGIRPILVAPQRPNALPDGVRTVPGVDALVRT